MKSISILWEAMQEKKFTFPVFSKNFLIREPKCPEEIDDETSHVRGTKGM